MFGKKPWPFFSDSLETQRATQSLQEVFTERQINKQELEQAALGDGSTITAFCTACGNQPPFDALFCDQCGLKMRGRVAINIAKKNFCSPDFSSMKDERLSSTSICSGLAVITNDCVNKNKLNIVEAAKPLSWTTQRWIAPCAALASVLIITLGIVIRYASAPPPTAQEVMEVIGRSNIKISAPSQDLLCLSNLPYHRHHVQIPLNDQVLRVWLDSLVQAGLYASPVEIIPEGMSSEASTTLLKYQTLPAINPWRRNGRLCVAERWVIDSVVPGSIRKEAIKPSRHYHASIIWRAEGIAPWLNQLPDVRTRLAGVEIKNGKLITITQHELD